MNPRHWPPATRLLSVLIVVNLALGAGLFALRSPERRLLATGPPPDLPAQIRELAALMDGNHKGEAYTLTLTDAELTAAVAAYLADSPDVPFKDVRVAVTGGRVVVDGTARGAAVGVPVRARLRVEARDGKPVVAIDQLGLGNTPLPGFVRQQVIAQANASLDLSGYDLGVTVEAITLAEGALTVRGKIT